MGRIRDLGHSHPLFQGRNRAAHMGKGSIVFSNKRLEIVPLCLNARCDGGKVGLCGSRGNP